VRKSTLDLRTYALRTLLLCSVLRAAVPVSAAATRDGRSEDANKVVGFYEVHAGGGQIYSVVAEQVSSYGAR
jgi:hypothetical protein